VQVVVADVVFRVYSCLGGVVRPVEVAGVPGRKIFTELGFSSTRRFSFSFSSLAGKFEPPLFPTPSWRNGRQEPALGSFRPGAAIGPGKKAGRPNDQYRNHLKPTVIFEFQTIAAVNSDRKPDIENRDAVLRTDANLSAMCASAQIHDGR
jgi:hypothetical protein